MPLGDSITEAASGYASYRYWLQKDLDREGVPFDFVGSRSGVLGGWPRFDDFDPDHEGHWGWTTGEVLERIDDWAADARPDVVLLHLGTNDLGRHEAVIPANLAVILEALRRANPEVVVFLARLIPVSGLAPRRLAALNDAIEQMGRRASTSRSPVLIVRHDEGFDAREDTYDGAHPNESGEKKMARKWFEAFRNWWTARDASTEEGT